MNRFLDILNDKNHFVKTGQGGLFYRPYRRMVGGMIREDEKKTSPTIDEIEEKIQEDMKAMNEITHKISRDRETIVKLRNREANAEVKAMNEIMESIPREEEELKPSTREKIKKMKAKSDALTLIYDKLQKMNDKIKANKTAALKTSLALRKPNKFHEIYNTTPEEYIQTLKFKSGSTTPEEKIMKSHIISNRTYDKYLNKIIKKKFIDTSEKLYPIHLDLKYELMQQNKRGELVTDYSKQQISNFEGRYLENSDMIGENEVLFNKNNDFTTRMLRYVKLKKEDRREGDNTNGYGLRFEEFMDKEKDLLLSITAYKDDPKDKFKIINTKNFMTIQEEITTETGNQRDFCVYDSAVIQMKANKEGELIEEVVTYIEYKFYSDGGIKLSPTNGTVSIGKEVLGSQHRVYKDEILDLYLPKYKIRRIYGIHDAPGLMMSKTKFEGNTGFNVWFRKLKNGYIQIHGIMQKDGEVDIGWIDNKEITKDVFFIWHTTDGLMYYDICEDLTHNLNNDFKIIETKHIAYNVLDKDRNIKTVKDKIFRIKALYPRDKKNYYIPYDKIKFLNVT